MNQNINWFNKIAPIWHVYREPVTPSKGEISLMERMMQRGKKILILGATPRYRDLGYRLKSEVTVCDMNLAMIVSTTKLMKFKEKVSRETWVIANWLELPLKTNYFDYVLGDFVICNIPLLLRHKFYVKIQQVLKDNGFFITRHQIIDTNLKAAQLIKYYADQKNPNMCEFQFAMESPTYKNKLKSFSLKDTRRAIKEFTLTQDVKRRKKCQSLYQKFISQFPFDKTWFLESQENEEKMLKKYFKVAAKKHAADHRLAYLC